MLRKEKCFSCGRGTTVGFQKNVKEGEASMCMEKGYRRVPKALRKEKLTHVEGYGRVIFFLLF